MLYLVTVPDFPSRVTCFVLNLCVLRPASGKNKSAYLLQRALDRRSCDGPEPSGASASSVNWNGIESYGIVSGLLLKQSGDGSSGVNRRH